LEEKLNHVQCTGHQNNEKGLKVTAVSLEVFLGYFTGLWMLSDDLPLPVLIGTSLLIHILDSIMCRLFARNNGYPKNLWTALGFFFGIWAIATLIFLPKRRQEPGQT
jgi:hypothetical protein